MPSPCRILEITSYPPPRAGWGMRVYFLKRHLERAGHRCVVLNIGRSRTQPSPEYETVHGGADYVRKVWRFSREGFDVHAHVNGDSPKGFVLTLVAELINLAWGRRCFLTFHAGPQQKYFPVGKAPWLLPMYWLMFAIPSRIVCNSEAVAARIREYGVAASKIAPIPAFSRQYLEFERGVSLGEPLERFYSTFPKVLFSYVNVRPEFHLDVLVDGFARLAAMRPEIGLVLCGVSGYQESGLWDEICGRIARQRLRDRIAIVDDLDHDQFLNALERSAVYVRTPSKDGVASSVLEALSLRVPVVAAENGARPPGVLTYDTANAEHLAERVAYVLDARERVVGDIVPPEIRDTLAEEAALLTGGGRS